MFFLISWGKQLRYICIKAENCKMDQKMLYLLNELSFTQLSHLEVERVQLG